MDGCYVGRVAVDDPLHPILCRVLDEGMGVTKVRSFDAFRLNGSNEVYGYEECGSGVKLVCKFFGGRFGWDRKRAAWTADREYHSYKELRRYELVGSPHHVIRPLALEPGINCALVLEYYGGEQLSRAIDGAIHAGDDERLYDRLTALGFYLATQHNRTANGARVDFAEDCAYLDAQLATLRGIGRIGPWDEDELRWLSGLWRMRDRMWADQKVWLHGGRHARELPLRRRHGRRRDRPGADEARRPDVRRRSGRGRAAARVHAGHRGRGVGAEPFIGHFLWEYAGHFPHRDAAFASITSRVPYYMALNLLRVARNDYIDREHGAGWSTRRRSCCGRHERDQGGPLRRQRHARRHPHRGERRGLPGRGPRALLLRDRAAARRGARRRTSTSWPSSAPRRRTASGVRRASRSGRRSSSGTPRASPAACPRPSASGCRCTSRRPSGRCRGGGCGATRYVRAVLDALAVRFPLAVVTDGQSAWARGELHAVGLDRYFDPVVVSGDHGYRKPDRRLFERALAHLGVAAEHAVYVGNDMHRDVYGAREAGMTTIMFASGQGTQTYATPVPTTWCTTTARCSRSSACPPSADAERVRPLAGPAVRVA